MPIPIYPDTLPIPKSVQVSSTDQLLAGPESTGPRDRRRYSLVPGATVGATFKYLLSEYKQFIEWFKTDLLFGHKWFVMKLPSADGIIEHIVRFVDRPKGVLNGHHYWEMTCQLEVRERRGAGGTQYHTCVQIWTEFFIEGFTPYTHQGSGSIDQFVIARDYEGTNHLVNFDGQIFEDETCDIYRSTSGRQLNAVKITLEMSWVQLDTMPWDNDSLICKFMQDDSVVLTTAMRDDTDTDALRRPYFIFLGEKVVLTPDSEVPFGNWCQLTLTINQGVGACTWTFANMVTLEMWSGNVPDVDVAGHTLDVNRLMFTMNDGVEVPTGRFRQIIVYGEC